MSHLGSDRFYVRVASASDNEILAELGAHAFSNAFGPHNTPEDMALYLRQSFGPQIQSAELADPANLFVVAEVESKAVGYARMRAGEPPIAIQGAHPIEIVRFYPHPDWIGRGVGAALMQACLREARQRGKETIWLDVWELNHRARDFYLRWGFRVVGTQPFLLGNDLQTDLLMQRAVPVEDEPNLAGAPPAR